MPPLSRDLEKRMDTIGRYQIAAELGRGAMGIVYRASDPVIDRVVALKTLRNAEGFKPAVYDQLRERFLREARAAGKLRHPGIVSILDAGTDPRSGVSYIAMELVSGRDLEGLLGGGRRFAPEEAARLVAAAADALDYAHAQGVVHRDIKPANLLLGEDGLVRVADFGIARIEESGLTRTGQVLGSPAYMSPEQITGSAVDGRSDIFSLGVVLYELLTGERPFLGESMSTLAYQIVHVEPIPPRKVNPAIPAVYEMAAVKALAKGVADRYQRARDLAKDLVGTTQVSLPAAFLPASAPTGTLLDGAGAGRPIAPTMARPSRARLAVAAGAVLLLAAALGWWVLRGSVEQARSLSGVPDPRRTVAERRQQAPAPPASTPTPVPAPTRNAISWPFGEKARLFIDFDHHLTSGSVVVTVDGDEVWRSALRAKKQSRFKVPGIDKDVKLAREKLTGEVQVKGGRRLVAVTVSSGAAGVDDSEALRMELQDDRTNWLKIRVNRLTRAVSLEGG